MKNVLTAESEEFTVPEGIVSRTIDPSTGLLVRDESSGIKEYFKEGTEPRQFVPSSSVRKVREKDINLNFD
jgi:membrane carboxypeptidase/penicillin-binding protein